MKKFLKCLTLLKTYVFLVVVLSLICAQPFYAKAANSESEAWTFQVIPGTKISGPMDNDQYGPSTCEISKSSQDQNRGIDIRIGKGDNEAYLDLKDLNWSFPPSQQVEEVIFKVGGRTLLDDNTYPTLFDLHDSFSVDEFVSLEKSFVAGNILYIEFPGMKESTWAINLQDSQLAIEQMNKCISETDIPAAVPAKPISSF